MRRRNAVRRVGKLVGRFQHLEHAACGGDTRLQLGQHARHLVKGLGVLVGVGQKARQPADRQRARQRRQRADDADRRIDDGIDEPRGGIRQRARVLRLEADIVELGVIAVKILERLLFIGERLDDALVADVFLHIGGDIALQDLLLAEPPRGELADEARHEQRQRREEEHRQRDAPVGHQHEYQGADDRDHAREEL